MITFAIMAAYSTINRVFSPPVYCHPLSPGESLHSGILQFPVSVNYIVGAIRNSCTDSFAWSFSDRREALERSVVRSTMV